jgi:uncharacterized protein
LRYSELQGFLFAVVHAPEVVPSSDWIPAVFGGEEPEFTDADEARTITTALMEEYNAVSAVSRDGLLPPGCVLLDDPMANLEEGAPITSWSRGFREGYRWLQEIWTAYAQMARGDREPGAGAEDDEPDPEMELVAMVTVLGFFSSRTFAGRVCEETHSGDLPGMAAIVHRTLPDAVTQYASLGAILQEVDAFVEQTPYRRETPKVGRNDPCPCGSGRKYKRCCGG